MKRQIIITDLTRFGDGNPNVCTAGIDSITGECIRPMPYLTHSTCKRLGILPGGILSGDFTFKTKRIGPHQEDSTAKEMKFHGACSSEAFLEVLEESSYDSLSDGFEISLPDGDRGIPPDHPIDRSIVTIRAIPGSIEVMEDSYRPGKLKLNFSETNDRRHRYFPIADLGFHEFAQAHRSDGKLGELNEWIRSQKEVYLRVGLSRAFQPTGKKNACWMQVNGLYTFPEAPPGIRIHVR